MEVVWDEPKRMANLAKHGLNFADFIASFDLETALQLPGHSGWSGRPRFRLVGRWGVRMIVVAVVSPLGSEALSLISVRPASQAERKLYDST